MTTDEKDVCGRIREILQEEKLSDHKAAQQMSAATGEDFTLHNVASMKVRPGFGVDKLTAFVLTFTAYNERWILTGRGQKYRQPENKTLVELTKKVTSLEQELAKKEELMGEQDVNELRAENIRLKEKLADCKLELADQKMKTADSEANRKMVEALQMQVDLLKKELVSREG